MSRRLFVVTRTLAATSSETGKARLEVGEGLFAEFPVRPENGLVTFEQDNFHFQAPERDFRDSTQLKNPAGGGHVAS